MLVTTPNGISAKLFGPWITTKNRGNMEFINTPELDDRRQLEIENELGSEELVRITTKNKLALMEAPAGQTREECDVTRYYTKKDFWNLTRMCLELETLFITLKRQNL